MEQVGLDQHWRAIYKNQQSDFRAKALAELVSSYLIKEEPVLDLGCGACGLTLKLLKQGFQVVAIDVSDEMLAMGREVLIEEGFDPTCVLKSSVWELVENNRSRFKQIVCLDVIEHIEDDVSALSALFSLLKPGGRLVLAVPALQYLYGPKDVELGHYRRYNRQTLMNLFRTQPFKIIDSRYWNFLGFFVTFVYLKIFQKKVDESIRKSGKKNFLQRLFVNFLQVWFGKIENKIRPPIGLTLLVVANKI